MSREDKISFIKSTIQQYIPASTVYLFGSQAKGVQKNDSDFDILVISNQFLNTYEILKFKSFFRKKFAKERIDADIIIETFKDAEEKQKLPGHIVQSAINTGLIL
jgi:predicted nucleotidyltransferase